MSDEYRQVLPAMRFPIGSVFGGFVVHVETGDGSQRFGFTDTLFTSNGELELEVTLVERKKEWLLG